MEGLAAIWAESSILDDEKKPPLLPVSLNYFSAVLADVGAADRT
jgi:hypothetical protein